ncbi:MAG: sensor domain-containing diguanylate cyclase [Armatimonadota bacterium]
MMNPRQSWYRWWTEARTQFNFSGLSLLTVSVMIIGIFTLTRDSSLVSILLLIPVAVLAWMQGWLAGVLAALVVSSLITPYLGVEHSLISPLLAWDTWAALSLVYVLLGILFGLHALPVGEKTRLVEAEKNAAEQENLAEQRYQELLNEMKVGQEQAQRMNKEVVLLNTITTAVNSSLDITQIHLTALASIGTILDVDVVQLYGLSFKRGQMVLQSSRPPIDAAIAQKEPVRLPAKEGLFGKVLQSNHVEIIGEATHDLHLCPMLLGDGMRTVMAVPLRGRTRIIGVLLLGRKSSLIFNEDDGRFLESVGRILSVAMENAKLFTQARALSLSDELTGLPNRRMFNIRLAMDIDRTRMSNSPLCLILFDLDFFKALNDQYGHPAGDEVLRQFSRVVGKDIRGSDLFCRYGGEEFALIVPDTPLKVATAIALRICRFIEQTPFFLEDGTILQLSISGGVAIFGGEITSGEELVAAADQALYAAKLAGRNRVEVYNRSMKAQHPALM